MSPKVDRFRTYTMIAKHAAFIWLRLPTAVIYVGTFYRLELGGGEVITVYLINKVCTRGC